MSSYLFLSAIILQILKIVEIGAQLENYENPAPIMCAFEQYFIRKVYFSLEEAAEFCDRTSNCSGVEFCGEAAPEPDYYIPVGSGCPLFISTPSSAPSMIFYRKNSHLSSVNNKTLALENSTSFHVDFPEFSNSFEMIRPPLVLQQYSGQDFEQLGGIRCSSGSQLAASFSVDACARFCNSSNECAGFNVDQWGPCVAVSANCGESRDTTSTFYRKLSSDFFTMVEIVVQAAPPELDDTMPTSFSINYQIIEGSRCTGGLKVGEIADSPEQCAAFCEKSPNCNGFNLLKGSSTCVARSDCSNIPDNNSVFYKKLLHEPPSSDAETFNYTGSAADTGEEVNELELIPVKTSSARPNFYSETTAIPANSITSTEDPELSIVAKAEMPDSIRIFPDYQIVPGRRCAGGPKMYEIAESAEKCVSTCSKSHPCFGFNYNLMTGACSSRTFDCRMIVESNYVFYAKVNGPPQTPSSFSEPVVTSSSTDASDAAGLNYNQSKPYVQFPGKRCIGGSKIGDVGDSSEKCAALCNQATDCGGFNLEADTGECVARTSDCSLIDGPTAIYYKKVGTPQAQDTTITLTETANTTASNVTSTEEPSVVAADEPAESPAIASYDSGPLAMYTVKHGIRCTGGLSKIGTSQGLEVCAAMCLTTVECIGFNYSPIRDRCILRTAECSEQPATNKAISFYRIPH